LEKSYSLYENEAFKVHQQSIYHGLTVKHLSLLPNETENKSVVCCQTETNQLEQFRFGVLFAWIRRPFSSALTSFSRFFLFLIFKFHIASLPSHGKYTFYILWAAANGVHRNSHKIWNFLCYFLSSSEYRAEKQTRRNL